MKVTDTLGFAASATATVSVAAQPPTTVTVSSITVAKSSPTLVTAIITVKTPTGAAVKGAQVTVWWNGKASGTTTGVTDANGVVVATAVLKRGGSQTTATVTGVAGTGYVWDGVRKSATV